MDDCDNDKRRVDEAIVRTIETKASLEGHEKLCAERYTNILSKMEELRSLIISVAKVGAMVAFVILSLLFSKTAFPILFDAILHGAPEVILHGH